MKKEMLISVLIGLVFGLIVVYGIYTAHNSLSAPNQPTKELGVTPSPDANVITNGALILHSPEDEIVVSEPKLTITGTTNPKTYVVIFINDQEKLITADELGHFSAEGELELGSNIIQVHSLDEDGQNTIIERTVIYTTQPLLEPESASIKEDQPTANASEAAKNKE